TGGLLANVGYALQPYIDGQKIPATYPVIAADDITQRKPAKWIVRTGWTTSQPMHPFAEWLIKHTKYRKVTTIGMDYAFGYETVRTLTALHDSEGLDTPQNRKFAKAFEARAGKIPSYYSEACYTGARWIVEAIKALQGRVEDRDMFLAALRRVSIKDAARGPM